MEDEREIAKDRVETLKKTEGNSKEVENIVRYHKARIRQMQTVGN